MLSTTREHELGNECPPAFVRTSAFHRAFDFGCAAAGLLFLSPLFCAIAVAIKFGDGGPVFYAQERVGKDFGFFRVCKFRTMVTGADRDGLLTTPGDSRLTRMGRLLRRYKLDELPQLFNVIRGEMQLVGARPEVERYVQVFRSQFAVILQDRPGITDPASLAYRREDQMFSCGNLERQYVDEILPAKLRLSMDYQRQRSFLSDIQVLLRTVFSLVT
jgi:lipopolysaccharide/colanic/teichoic acid biosynthesis glycosyltransferase